VGNGSSGGCTISQEVGIAACRGEGVSVPFPLVGSGLDTGLKQLALLNSSFVGEAVMSC
jgi:hypothetical protein